MKKRLAWIKSKHSWKNVFTLAICCILVAVLAVTFNYELLFAARAAYDSNARAEEVQRQTDEHSAEFNAEQTGITFHSKRNSYDLERVIYDPDLGKAFEKTAFSTLSAINY